MSRILYADEQDLISAYGEETVRLLSGEGEPAQDAVTAALRYATELAESYIGSRYELPLGRVPPVLSSICCDSALWRLSWAPGAMTDETRDRYARALAWLQGVAKGVVSLGLEQAPPSPGGGGAQLISEPRRFTRSTLGGL